MSSTQLIFADATGEHFRDPTPPEEQIKRNLKRLVDSGKAFCFEDAIRGVESPPGKDRRGCASLLRPWIDSKAITQVDAVHSSEPSHNRAWKTMWIRADCLPPACGRCGQPKKVGRGRCNAPDPLNSTTINGLR